MNAIFKRVSVRKFTEEKPSKENISLLLKAAMQSPSAGNQQAWHFTVIENKEKLIELSTISPYSMCIKNAPLAILVSYKEDGIFNDLIPIDCAIACENILLEAVELNMSGTFIAIYPDKKRIANLNKYLNLDTKPFAIIPLGYPLKEKTQEDRYDINKIDYIK